MCASPYRRIRFLRSGGAGAAAGGAVKSKRGAQAGGVRPIIMRRGGARRGARAPALPDKLSLNPGTDVQWPALPRAPARSKLLGAPSFLTNQFITYVELGIDNIITIETKFYKKRHGKKAVFSNVYLFVCTNFFNQYHKAI